MTSPVNPNDPFYMGGITGAASTVAEPFQDYVGDMMGSAYGMLYTPYEAYEGPLTAGESDLQTGAFDYAADMGTPDYQPYMDNLSDLAGVAEGNTYNMDPSAFASNYTSPAYEYDPAFMDSNVYNTPEAYQSTQFKNFYTPPSADLRYSYDGSFDGDFYSTPTGNMYNQKDVTTNRFNTDFGREYMNPYLELAMAPQLRDAQLAADQQRLQDAARLTKAGAFGGSRQAIMESEINRNMLDDLMDIRGRGYAEAYDAAQKAFADDENRSIGVQTTNETNRRLEGDQWLRDAENIAKYGLQAAEGREKYRSKESDDLMQIAEKSAEFARDAERDTEASKQYGWDQYMDATENEAAYQLRTNDANNRYAKELADLSMQDAANTASYGDSAANRFIDMENSRVDSNRSNIDQIAGLVGQGSDLAKDQFFNNVDYANLLADLGREQRGIEAEGIAADITQWEDEQNYPRENIQLMAEMLNNVPISARTALFEDPQFMGTLISSLSAGAEGADTLATVLELLGIAEPAPAESGA